MTRSKQLRVGLLGGGQIAWIHGRLIVKEPDATLVGIADIDRARARQLARELGVDKVYEDAAGMIEDQQPDIIHVLTPPDTHPELSMMAMSRGCHVLVEKPMATTLAAAEAMVETAKRHNVRLCAGYNMLFDDLVQAASNVVATGAVGEVVSVEAHYAYNALRNPALVEDGAHHCHWSYRLNGGPLEDLMPHMAALVLPYLGGSATEVTTVTRNRGVLPAGWDDEVRVLLASDRVLGMISISLSERPDLIALTVKGTRGEVRANLFSGVLTVQTRSALPRALARGLSGFQLSAQSAVASLKNLYNFAAGRIDKSSGLAKLISRFYESVRTGTEPPLTPEQCLAVVDVTSRIWPVPRDRTLEKGRIPPAGPAVAPRVLVTGASGFIGTHLVRRLLSEGVGVRALVRQNSFHAGRLKDLDVQVVEGDLTEAAALQAAMRGIETVYHAAAATHNGWSENESTTIEGTRLLLDAALGQNVGRLVLLSSLAVFDTRKSRGRVIREDSPLLPNPRQNGAYAYSKIVVEGLALASHREHGLGVTVVRPGMVIGPLGHVWFPHLGYHYGDRLFLTFGRGDQVLPLTYVENTVDGIYRAATHERAIGQAYNLVDEGAVTARQYIEQLISTTRAPGRIIGLPYPLPYCATATYELAAGLNLMPKGVTSRAQLKAKWYPPRFDSSKARNELGWTARVPLGVGLQETFSWYARRNGR